MEKQLNARLDVRHIPYEDVCEICEDAEFAQLDGNIDFGLFDSDVVLVWLLDKKTRRVNGGKILVDAKQFSAYKKLFWALHFYTRPFDPSAGMDQFRSGASRPSSEDE